MKKLLFLSTFFLVIVISGVNRAKAQITDGKNSSAVKLSQEEKEERNKRIAVANAEAIYTHTLSGAKFFEAAYVRIFVDKPQY